MSKTICSFEKNKLVFWILPGNPWPGFNHVDLYNRAYRHYKQIWHRTLDRRAGQGVFDSYGFFRQSFVFVITHDDDIVAQICGSFLNIDHEITHDLQYFYNFKGKALDVLRNKRAKTLMTLEFSATNPKYAPRKANGICFGEIITYLGFFYGMNFGIDAVTGLPRRLSGTNDKVVQSGFRRIDESKTRCGLTVDVVLGFRGEIVAHQDRTMRLLINALWSQKKDLIQSYHSPLPERLEETGLEFNAFIEN